MIGDLGPLRLRHGALAAAGWQFGIGLSLLVAGALTEASASPKIRR